MEKRRGEARTGCIKCAAPLSEGAGTGRPAAYCGDACRRAAEFEIRRASARLERLEDQRSVLRINLAGGGALAPELSAYGREHWRGIWKKQLGALEAEIASDEARLRELLAAGPDEAA